VLGKQPSHSSRRRWPASEESGPDRVLLVVCHCAGRLADSLADNKQVPSDGCKRSWRAEGVCRTTARLPPSYSTRVQKCSVVISLAMSEMTSLEGRQGRLRCDFRRRSMLVRYRS
jgi:hypothetical protein